MLRSLSGGVRALIQLVVLGIIEKRVGLAIPIEEFFDLIVGTRWVFTGEPSRCVSHNMLTIRPLAEVASLPLLLDKRI